MQTTASGVNQPYIVGISLSRLAINYEEQSLRYGTGSWCHHIIGARAITILDSDVRVRHKYATLRQLQLRRLRRERKQVASLLRLLNEKLFW